MSKRMTEVGVCAVLLFCSAKGASASIVTTPEEAEKHFKTNTSFNLGLMKADLKDTLTIFKENMASIKADLADGTLTPFTAAALVASEIQNAYEDVSQALSTYAGAVDSQGSNFITQIGGTFFPGARHGEGSTLDKFIAGVKKELDKFAATINKELIKIRKAFIKNDGSFTNIKFIATVHPFPRSFDPTPSDDSGNLNATFLNMFLAGIAVIDLVDNRQDVFVIGMCRAAFADVQFRQGNQTGSTEGALVQDCLVTNGIFVASISVTDLVVDKKKPLFADGFEANTTTSGEM